MVPQGQEVYWVNQMSIILVKENYNNTRILGGDKLYTCWIVLWKHRAEIILVSGSANERRCYSVASNFFHSIFVNVCFHPGYSKMCYHFYCHAPEFLVSLMVPICLNRYIVWVASWVLVISIRIWLSMQSSKFYNRPPIFLYVTFCMVWQVLPRWMPTVSNITVDWLAALNE